jgi:hypothetical protein
VAGSGLLSSSPAAASRRYGPTAWPRPIKERRDPATAGKVTVSRRSQQPHCSAARHAETLLTLHLFERTFGVWPRKCVTDDIAASLRRRQVNRVCHITPCHRLPEVFAGGGLLSFNERRTRGVAEDSEPHYWGPPGRKEALGDFVLCSFMPSWGLVQGHEDELAILIFEAETICCRPGTLFCPTNTARSLYSDGQILAMSGAEAFDACFPNPDTYQAGDSEILAPRVVSLTDIRGMLFCDQEAFDFWQGKIDAAFAAANPRPTPPSQLMVRTDGVRGLWGCRFPGNWRPRRRIRT